MVMMVSAADGRRQILDVGEIAAGSGVAKVGGQRGELGRLCGIAFRCHRGGGGGQVSGNPRHHGVVFGGVKLLQVLQRAQQLGKWRKELLPVELVPSMALSSDYRLS